MAETEHSPSPDDSEYKLRGCPICEETQFEVRQFDGPEAHIYCATCGQAIGRFDDVGRELYTQGGPKIQPEEKDEWDPEKDPFACSGCGTHLSESSRVAGEDYCRDCRQDGGS